MVKLIEAIEQCTEAHLRWQFLDEIIGLSKNYYMNKNIFVGNKWRWLDANAHGSFGLYASSEYWCWCPLGFEGNIVYK